jgi:hypothetical protein
MAFVDNGHVSWEHNANSVINCHYAVAGDITGDVPEFTTMIDQPVMMMQSSGAAEENQMIRMYGGVTDIGRVRRRMVDPDETSLAAPYTPWNPAFGGHLISSISGVNMMMKSALGRRMFGPCRYGDLLAQKIPFMGIQQHAELSSLSTDPQPLGNYHISGVARMPALCLADNDIVNLMDGLWGVWYREKYVDPLLLGRLDLDNDDHGDYRRTRTTPIKKGIIGGKETKQKKDEAAPKTEEKKEKEKKKKDGDDDDQKRSGLGLGGGTFKARIEEDESNGRKGKKRRASVDIPEDSNEQYVWQIRLELHPRGDKPPLESHSTYIDPEGKEGWQGHAFYMGLVIQMAGNFGAQLHNRQTAKAALYPKDKTNDFLLLMKDLPWIHIALGVK